MSDRHYLSFPRLHVKPVASPALNALTQFERAFEGGLHALAGAIEDLPSAPAAFDPGDAAEAAVEALLDLHLAFDRVAAALRKLLEEANQ